MRVLKNKSAVLFLLLTILSIENCTPNRQSITTVILVRHAEKSDQGGEDMPLSDAGYQRAELLANMLADVDIGVIYSTQWQRNQLTAGPLSNKKNVAVVTLEIHDASQHARELATNLKQPEFRGKTVVCIEHSNTIRLILEELGISTFDADAEYSQMFYVTFSESTKPQLNILRYGPFPANR